MRVLHILEATAGGTRRHVLDLLPQLQARGIACSLIYSPVRNPRFHHDAEYLSSFGIIPYAVPMGHRWSRRVDGHALRTIFAHLRNEKYDLIHCHSSNAGLLGRLANAACMNCTPLIYTPHYIAFGAGLPRAQRRAALYLEKLLAPLTSHYIAVSRHECSLLCRVLKAAPSRASVIYNGIGVQDPVKNQASKQRFIVGCFGRLTAQKNQALLIRALPEVLRDIPDTKLVLVGSGEDESTLRVLAQRFRCKANVEFCGEISDPYAEYIACDVVAQPSRWEGCSYAILEAMAAARAVMASTAGGNPEVVGEAGVLLPPHDADAWSQALKCLARDKERRIMLGNAAQQRIRQHFSCEAMVEKTIAVYGRVLS